MNANSHNTQQAAGVPQRRRSGRNASKLRYKHLAFGVGLALGSLLVCGVASAASGVAATTSPSGGRVVGGAGSIVQHGASTIVNQQSRLLALDWQSFNVGKDASVLFKQPGTRAIALNRILDQNPSQIFGKISSNGQIFLINTHGIIFGASAQLNVGGLVASTLDLTPDDFLKRHFDLDAHGGHAGVVNHGTIAAATGGSVSLVGGHVENDGVIVADYGHINLDGADKAVLDFDGNGLINVEITGALQKHLKADQNAVANKGKLQATSGTVVLQASAAKNLFTNLVNNSGVIKAGGISTVGGVVRLVGSGGNTITSGNIDVSGTHGGSVQVLSDANVGVTGGSIDASGAQGGGSIRVGGGWQGGEGLPTAQATYVAPDAVLDASAIQSGNGGSVVVWGSQVNNFYGNISARGGALGGDGGRVETSSHYGLDAQGKVDASAPLGRAGTWLLDPYDVTISTGTDANTGSSPNFTATGTGSVVNAGEIGTALTGGSNVSVFTGSSGTETGDITLSAPITASGNGSLYLMAAGSIFVNNSITGAGTGKPLNVYLWANYGGTAPSASPYTYAYASAGSCTTCAVIIGDSANGSIATYGGNVDIRTGDPTHAGGSVSIGATASITGTIDTTDGTNPSGSVTVAATGIAENAATGNYVYAGTATFDAGAGAIDLGNTSNDFTGAVSLDNSGANNVTLDNGSNALELGVSSVGTGTLTVTGAGITQSGAITQAANAGTATFNAGAHVLTLDQANDFTGAVSLNNSGANNVTLDNGSNLLTLDTSAIGSGVSSTISATGITQTGAITQTTGGYIAFHANAGALDLGNTSNDFAGTVSLNNSGANNVTLDNGGNALTLGDSTLGSGAVTVQHFGTSALTLAGNIITNGGAVDLDGAVDMEAAGGTTIDTTNNGGAAGGGISITGAVNGGGAAPQSDTLTAGTGAVILGGAVGDSVALGGLTVTGSSFSAAGTLNVQSYTGGGQGNLSITTTGGDITQNGVWTVGGTSTFSAGSNAITLGNASNTFTGTVTLSNSGANDVTLANTAPLKLGNVTVGSGTLQLTGAGIAQGTGTTITQAAGAGAATFNAGVGVIDLGNTGNDFIGAVSVNSSGANAVTLDNGSNPLQLGASSVGTGTLSISGVGISQSGAFTQAAGAGVATFNAGTGALDLGNNGNNFTSEVSLNSSGTVTLDNGGNALELTDSTLGSGPVTVQDFGTLTLAGSIITSGGTVTLKGAVKTDAIGGTTIDTTNGGAAGANIDITGAVNGSGAASPNGVDTLTLNAGTGVVTLGGAVGDSTALGGLTVTGKSFSAASTLNVQSNTSGGQGNLSITTGSAITQKGAWTVGGTSNFNAGANTITLDTSGNDFTGAVSLSNSGANNVALDNGAYALTLGNLTTGSGTLSLSGTGITQAASTSITQATSAGAATFNARVGVLTLGNSGNDFTGAVALNNSGANAVTLDNGSNVLLLGTSIVGSGTLTVTGVGITQSGAITQAMSAGTAKFNAGAGVLTLDNTSNDFTGPVSLNNSGANNVTLDNGSNALLLGTSSVGSGTLIVTGAGITQSGAITQAANAGSATFNAGANALTLDQANDFTGAVSLNNSGANNVTLDNGSNALQVGASSVGSGTLTVSGNGITQTGAITQAASAGAATFDAGTGAITLANSGNSFTGLIGVTHGGAVEFGGTGTLNIGTVANTGSLTLDNAATLHGDITTSGAQTYKGAVALASDVTLSGNGVAFQSTVDNATSTAESLTVKTGTGAIVFGGAVGGNATTGYLGDLNISGGGQTTFQGSVQSASLVASNDVTLAGNVTTTGAQTYSGAVSLDGSVTLKSDGGGIALGDVTNNAGSSANLIVDAGSGAVTFNGTVQGGSATEPLNQLSVTADGGITQAAASTLDIFGPSSFDAGTGAITLNGNNALSGAVSLAGGVAQITNTGALTLGTLTTGNLTVTTTGALDLGSGKVAGNLSATSNGGAITQDTTTGKALTITGTTELDAGTGAITLANSGNSFAGLIGVTHGGAVEFGGTGTLNIGTVANTGSLTLDNAADLHDDITTSGAQTYNGAVTLNAPSITFDTTNGGSVAAGANISFGSSVDGTTAGGNDLTLDAGTGGTVSFNGAVGSTTALGALTLNGSGAVTFTSTVQTASLATGMGTTSLAGNVTTTGAQTYSGLVDLNGSVTLKSDGGGITLGDVTNNFGFPVNLTVNAGSGAVAFNGIVQGGTGTEPLNQLIVTGGGGIVQASGSELHVTGVSSFDAGSAAITLNGANDFRSAVNLTGGTTSISDGNALTLGTLATGDLTVASTGALDLGSGKVAGNLSATSHGGAITQDTTSGKAFTVTGTTLLDAGTGTITLANSGNDFGGAVSLTSTGTAVTLDNGSNALKLGDVNVGTGALTLKGTGISQTSGSKITQAAGAAATTLDAGTTGALVLGNPDNDITGAVAATGAGVTITTTGNLDLASLSDASNHDLSLIAGGTLTMPSGAIDTGSGNITLETGSGTLLAPALTGHDITVQANGGALSIGAVSGNNVALTGHGGITLSGNLTANGTLGLTSTNAPISLQGGTITAKGITTVAAGSGGISLTGGNDFEDTVNLTGGDTMIHDTAALTLGTLQTGNLTATSQGTLNLGTGTVAGVLKATSNNGSITQSIGTGDSLTVQGSAALTAGGGAIKLANTGNDFQNAVTATGAGVAITDTNNLEIAGLTDSGNGNVSLIAGGQIYGTGAIDAGTGAITLIANGGALTTDQLIGGDISLTGADGITLGGSGVQAGGALTLNSGTSISQNAGAVITADSFTGHSAGATTLDQANAITTLDGFTANGFSLNNAQALTVAAGTTVDGGAGGTALTATAGDLTIDGTVGNANGTTALTANAGAITEGANGMVIAGTLTGGSGGDTMLAQANQIDTLGQFKADDLTLANHKALAVTGPLVTTGNISLTTIGPGNVLSVGQALTGGVITLNSAGDLGVTNAIQGATVNLTANGNLSIDAAVNSGTGVVTLTQNGSGGQISQGSGSVITAGTLTGTAQGGVALEQANAVTNLGDFTAANGFSLNNGQALMVTAGHMVDGGSSTQLTAGGAGSDLTINGSVQGTAVGLNASHDLVEGSNGTVTASVLTGNVAHNAQLTGANAITGLGNFTANGLTLNDTGALAITAGSTVDGGANTALTIGGGATGNLAIDGTLKGTTTTLQVAGDISEAANGALSAGTLSGSSGGSTLLTGNNGVANLGDFTANGFALTTDPGLTVVAGKTVDGRSSVALTTTGSGNDIDIDGTLTGIRVTLTSSGAINEGANGMLQTGTLTGSSIGDATLGQVEIGTLDTFKAKSLDLSDAQALTVAGPVTTTSELSLATTGSGHALTINQALSGASIKLASADDLTIGGAVIGTGVALASNGNMAINAAVDSGTGTTTLTQAGSGAITAGANGAITAGTLTGSATGATMLGSATQFVGNQVGVLGGFSSPAGFSLTNDGTLTLASVGGSAYTVDAGNSNLYLAVKDGNLLQNGTNWLYDGTGTWSASGHIGLATAPIYVTGVDDQSVAFIGLPPAYFYAVDYQGNLLPLTGASSVNVPTSVLSSHSQGINGHTDHYIDFSVITANYRAYGVVPPGLLLPPDQWDCAPDQPSPELCPRGN